MPNIIVNVINIVLRKDPVFDETVDEIKELAHKVYFLEDKALDAERRLAEFEAQLGSKR